MAHTIVDKATPPSAGGPAPGRRRPGDDLPPWMRKTSRPVSALKAVVITGICLVMLYPIVYVIVMSLASPRQARQGVLFPTEFSLDAYRAIFSGGVVTQGLWVSFLVTATGTILSLAMTSTLAWGLTRTRQVPGARVVLVLVLASMFFGAGIIPNYLLIKQLGLLDSLWSLILPGMISAFNLVVMRNFFMELPRELMESARIDGAGEWRIFLRIVLPLSRPIMAVMGLFYAVGYWNSYFNALLYINDPEKWPIQVVLQQYVIAASPIPGMTPNPDAPPPPAITLQMAIIVAATLPILLVYPFVQRYFTSGVLTGAIKG
ncbi:ABC transporter permease subunit [Streptomyces sp. 3MP-14]|uniref:ABC transporter permease subunit n=1 Tax=Streptomyces mimosae TaxID=2586635 RepID=A0A5N6A1M5_9ACTN|nr:MULTISPECIES: carbohydrate ABC transporter permease [Streptomyces]KAB8161899.1 ABC transporter permease subunit [Streptomyces mimosae]KAB8173597.1 ABC transporter permease subunit [Streptomyces sp. 3MP-14]